MKINRVKLTNYAQHTNLDVRIETDFLGIVGENGSGKSNFINAISDAVSGDFHKKKSLIVTHGQKTGSIYLEGEFEANDSFVLDKSLGVGETTLRVNNQEIVGSDAVSSKILEKLDCDRSFLNNMVFVKQEDILGILFGRPAERNKLLQKFFGLEKAQRADVALSSWASTIPESVEIDESAIREEINQTNISISNTKEEIGEITADLSSLRIEVKKDVGTFEKLGKLWDRAKAHERSAGEIEKYKTEEKSLKKELKSLVAPKVTEEQISEWKDQLSTTKENLASSRDMKKFLESSLTIEHNHDDNGKCALCGSELLAEAKEEIQAKLTKYTESIKKNEAKRVELVEKIESGLSILHEYLGQESKITKRMEYIQSQLAALNIVTDGPAPKRTASEYKAGIDAYNAKQIDCCNMETKLAFLKSNLKGFDAVIRRCNNALSESEKTKKANEAIRVHKRRIIRLQGLFKHNGSATEIYVNTKMKRMCACINSYLTGFSAPYKVRVDKNNEFVCQFPNKNIYSGELSGGQKVILSLAFRFAACEVFTSKTNFIVLDEPTTWLDRKRIDSFGEVLSNVKSMSQRKHLQVFVVTHEKSLMPNFDQVIEFTETTEQTQNQTKKNTHES